MSMAQIPQMLPPVPAQPDAGTDVNGPRAQLPSNSSSPALSGTRPGSTNPVPQGNATSGLDDTRKATAVLTFFRNRMYKVDLSQPIDFTIRDYETCAEQFELDERQNVKYFVNVLEDSPMYFLLLLL